MEHDPRTFQSVNIGMTNVETGRDRFYKDDSYHGPPLSAWRCNLTALSQRYNLYFVATREGIAVYQPEFPFQKLSCKPQLNIPPTLAEAAAAGYIDEWRPHGINHLLVGDLGSEEILLVATDSGNVAAYHTKAIEEAIGKDPYKFSDKGRSDVVGLRAFFSHWVHESAWGLAIHKEGRMIAVSANKPLHVPSDDPSAKVTVFAFALTSQGQGSEDLDDSGAQSAGELRDWYDWNPNEANGESPTRDRNFRIVLGGDHGHIINIPSVSFVNNSEDPNGSWLLSTDLTGTMKLWRTWRGICYASYDCEGTHLGVAIRRQRDCGWLVAALDPSAFRPAMSMDQFCGYHRPRSAPQYQGHPSESYDISAIVRLKTPGRSQKHPLMGPDSDEEEELSEPEEVAEEWTDEEVEDEDRRRNLVLELDSLHIPTSNERTLPIVETTRSTQSPRRDSSSSRAVPTATTTQLTVVQNNDFITLDPVHDNEESEDLDDDELYSEEEDEDLSSGSPDSHTSISSVTRRTSVEVEIAPTFDNSPNQSGDNNRPSPTPSKRQRHERSFKDEIRIPTIAALQCSQFHVRLLNIPKARSPHFFCANILTQDLPEGMELSNRGHLARLSMMQQIPELGIVIIASQLGRCAVCTLTKNISNGALGVRVDWILPTRRQERAGHRPMQPLLGIAVAPIQGRALASSSEEDQDHEWARDQIVNGVKTTFDRSVLVLDATARAVRDESCSDDDDDDGETSQRQRWRSSHKHKTHRKRLRWTAPDDRPHRTNGDANHNHNPRSSLSSLSSQASISTRSFPLPQHSEPWSAVEPSRRYRLMLTYLDMTVLTYELERGVEREDVRGAVSARGEYGDSSRNVNTNENDRRGGRGAAGMEVVADDDEERDEDDDDDDEELGTTTTTVDDDEQYTSH